MPTSSPPRSSWAHPQLARGNGQQPPRRVQHQSEHGHADYIRPRRSSAIYVVRRSAPSRAGLDRAGRGFHHGLPAGDRPSTGRRQPPSARERQPPRRRLHLHVYSATCPPSARARSARPRLLTRRRLRCPPIRPLQEQRHATCPRSAPRTERPMLNNGDAGHRHQERTRAPIVKRP